MPLPTERTVTGKFTNPVTGEPYDGTDGGHYVIFEPVPDRWTDQGGNQILLGGGRVDLDVAGAFSENVVCTDASGVLPEEGRLWRLRQFVGGSWSPPQYIAVPVGDGSPLDITDILSVDVCGVPHVPVEGPRGPAGPAGPAGTTGGTGPAGPAGTAGQDGLDGGLDTGITFGGDINPSTSNPLAVDVEPLVGRIVDYSTDPPTVTSVVSPSVITVELDLVSQTRAVTWLLMDEDLNVIQQASEPSAEDRRTLLALGPVIQGDGEIITAQSTPVIIEQPINQFYDFLDAFGSFNMSGNQITPNGVNLTLDHSPGQLFSRGWNYYEDGIRSGGSPHIVATVGAEPAAWMHLLRTSGLEPAAATSTVDVGHYDNGGTLTAVGGAADRSVIHQLWIYPTVDGSELHALQYGQEAFNTLDDAVQAASTLDIVTNPALPGTAVLLAHLAVQHGATDLSDPEQAQLIPVSRFGGAAGGGGGGSVEGYAPLAGAEFTGPVGTMLADDDDVARYSRVVGDSQNRFAQLSDGTLRWGSGSATPDAELQRLAAGLVAFLGTDVLVGQSGGKALRLRQSGADLDLDGSGADLNVSVYEQVGFAGAQRSYLRLESGLQLAHAIGKWIFSDGPSGTAVHTIDGDNDQLGFHGAAPVARQSITGDRSDGSALESLLTALNNLGLIDDGSAAGPPMLEVANNLSDLNDEAAARENLGLGSAATLDAPAHVFDVTQYGAVGDGRIVTDADMTSGSAVLTCSTSAPFTVNDVGKNIMVLSAGASNETLVGTILSYTSATQVTLSVSASSTVTARPALYATDDTVAIQAAVDAAATYALAHSYAATVYIPPAPGHFYGVAGALKTGGSRLGNAQIALPVVPATGRKMTLVIEGAHTGAGVQHWQQLTPNTTGSTLVSFGLFANTSAQINSINASGNPSVIGGPTQPNGYGAAPGTFSNLYVDIGDLSILTCHSKLGLTYTAVDLSGVANCQIRDVMYATSGTVAPPAGSYQSPGVFATGLAIGMLLPANGNNDLTIIRNLTCGGGYTYGLLATEHCDIHGLRILYCWAALCPVGTYYSSVGAAHSIAGTLISIEQCTYLIYIFGPGTGGLGPTMYLRIDTETSTPRFGDRTSGTGLAAARGEVILAGLFTATGLTLDNPTGLKIRNSQLTYPITTKTGTYTATSFDEVILADASSGAFTVNLPTAVGRTDPITVKKTDSSANAVTVDASSTQLIDGQLIKRLASQWEYVTLVPSGSAWFVKAMTTPTVWRRRDFPDLATAESLFSGTAPVITIAQTTTPESGYLKYAPAGVALSGSDSTGPFAYRGAGSFTIGSGTPDSTYVLPVSKYPATRGSLTSSQAVWSVEFGTDADQFQIRLNYQTAGHFRLSIDNRKVHDIMQPVGGTTPGSTHLMKINLGSATPRLIRLDFYTAPFGGIFIPPTATMWSVPARGGRLMVFGDSISGGSAMNTAGGAGTWFGRLARMLGCTDAWNQSLGGTGYVTAGSFATLANRVAADVVAWNPDRLIVAAGYNDNGSDQTALGVAAASLYATIKAGLPNTQVYILGCWSPTGSPGASITNTDTTLRLAAANAGFPFISSITGSVYNAAGTLVVTQGPWITGTGRVGATTGTGNADLYVGSDAVHPTDEGHAYLARRVLAALGELTPA